MSQISYINSLNQEKAGKTKGEEKRKRCYMVEGFTRKKKPVFLNERKFEKNIQRRKNNDDTKKRRKIKKRKECNILFGK